MRLELARKTDLAIRAMRALGAAGDRIPGHQLAEIIGATAPFVSQVVHPLVQRGWLDSKPGPSGGYGLAVDPQTITILDVIELIEGPIDNGVCVLVGGPCGEDRCSVHEAWTDGRTELRAAFAKVSVVQE
ncbi:MAG: Rrf2 family transcriptional regulator [bacterium]|nr:Rrf2 family transcriptional regulator [bacterium]MCP4966084.1 Rrf2 family transcriptional regulator [bacterium]